VPSRNASDSDHVEWISLVAVSLTFAPAVVLSADTQQLIHFLLVVVNLPNDITLMIWRCV
jgi:hypothetical protein